MPNEDYIVNHLHEELKAIQRKQDNFEKKILFYDKLIWLCSALLVIFGGTGAFGFKLIDKASSDITSLEYRIKQLSDWEAKVSKSFAEIEEHKNKAISDITSYIQSLKGNLNTVSQSFIKQTASSIDNLTDEKITMLKELSGTLRTEMTITSDNLKKKLVEVAKHTNYVTQEELAERLINIRSKSLIIEDNDGKNIIKLYSDEDGGRFDVNNRSGKSRFTFNLSHQDQPYLRLYDSSSYNFFMLGTYTDTNMPFLSLGNPRTKKDMLIATEDDNGGFIRVYNKEGRLSGFLSASGNGDGYLKIISYSGKDSKVITP